MGRSRQWASQALRSYAVGLRNYRDELGHRWAWGAIPKAEDGRSVAGGYDWPLHPRWCLREIGNPHRGSIGRELLGWCVHRAAATLACAGQYERSMSPVSCPQ
jgi:hypothetical protein